MPDLAALNERSNERYRRSTVRFVALALVGLLSVLALAYVTQRQEAQIRRLVEVQRQQIYTSCLARVANLTRLNQSYARLIAIEQHNPFIDEKIRSERVAAYKTFQLTIPDCAADAGPGIALTPGPTP